MDVIGLSIGYGSGSFFSGACMIIIVLWWHDRMRGHVKNPWHGFTKEAFKGLGPMALLMIFGATSQAFKSWGCEYLTILSGTHIPHYLNIYILILLQDSWIIQHSILDHLASISIYAYLDLQWYMALLYLVVYSLQLKY